MQVFFFHIHELFWRAFYFSFCFVFTSFCCYLQIQGIIFLFSYSFLVLIPKSVFNCDFIFVSVFEAFNSYVTICFLVSFYLTLPFGCALLLGFLKPGLRKMETRNFQNLIFIFLGLNFFAVFIYFYVCLPGLLKFFLNFQELEATALYTLKLDLKIASYIFQMFRLLFFINVTFLFLGGIFFCFFLRLFSIGLLKNNRKFTFLVALVLGCCFSPPDILSQLFIGIPIFLSFETAIFLGCLKENLA